MNFTKRWIMHENRYWVVGILRVAIIGAGMTPIRRKWDRGSRELALMAIFEALDMAGIGPRDINGIFTVPQGYIIDPEDVDWLATQHLGEYFFTDTKAQAMVEIGGVSSLVALKYAAFEILMGRCNIALVYAAEKQVVREEWNPQRHMYLLYLVNGFYGPLDKRYGIMKPIVYYAMITQRYMYEYGVSREDLAYVPVVLRKHASMNEKAQFRDPITVEDVLKSKVVCPPLHILDCCPTSEGAAALILASEKVAKDLGVDRVYITGIGEHHDPTSFFPVYGSATEFPCARKAMEEALQKSGRKIKDIDVAEVYGPFSGTEVMLYEELGFFRKGEAIQAIKEDRTTIDGEIPINTSGGRLSLGHPPHVTPLAEVYEIFLQLTGRAGQRQVKDAEVGAVHAEHGAVNGSMVMILEKG